MAVTKHKSRYPKLLDEGIETTCQVGYNKIIAAMSKMIIADIATFAKNKRK